MALFHLLSTFHICALNLAFPCCSSPFCASRQVFDGCINCERHRGCQSAAVNGKISPFHTCSPEDLWRMESGGSPHLSVHTRSKQQEGLSIRCARRCRRRSERFEREVERTPRARRCLTIFWRLHPWVKEVLLLYSHMRLCLSQE